MSSFLKKGLVLRMRRDTRFCFSENRKVISSLVYVIFYVIKLITAMTSQKIIDSSRHISQITIVYKLSYNFSETRRFRKKKN